MGVHLGYLGDILEPFGVTEGHDSDFCSVLMFILEHFGVLLGRLLKSWGGLGLTFGDCLVTFVGNIEFCEMHGKPSFFYGFSWVAGCLEGPDGHFRWAWLQVCWLTGFWLALEWLLGGWRVGLLAAGLLAGWPQGS